MKLWQKIFISTLLLVILAVDVTAVLLLTNNHRLMVRREQERAASEYAYLSASLKDYVLYTRLQYNRILLSEEETADAVKTVKAAYRYIMASSRWPLLLSALRK